MNGGAVKYLHVNLSLPGLFLSVFRWVCNNLYSRARLFLLLRWGSPVASTNAPDRGVGDMNTYQACKNFWYYLACNSPAAFCPASCRFPLCIYILSNKLKGPPCLFLKFFFCTAPTSPVLSPLMPAAQPSEMLISVFSAQQVTPVLCSGPSYPAETWKKLP